MAEDLEQPALAATRIGVAADPANDALLAERATQLAGELSLTVTAPGDPAFDLLLTVTAARIELRATTGRIGPISCDFEGGAFAQRRRTTGARDLLPRALGFKNSRPLHVLDATAGLGRDAALLALLGCRVTAVERSPVIAALLRDGLGRAGLGDRVELITGDSREQLQQISEQKSSIKNRPDVIYLDPMFPHREKSAQVKKEMRITRLVTGEDVDAADLLSAALAAGSTLGVRVVVKRPLRAPAIPRGGKPDVDYRGTSVRYDAYLPEK